MLGLLTNFQLFLTSFMMFLTGEAPALDVNLVETVMDMVVSVVTKFFSLFTIYPLNLFIIFAIISLAIGIVFAGKRFSRR